MTRVSIDEVSPQEWDAYNHRRIQGLKDPDNYNSNGQTDQENINSLDTKMETDIFESLRPYNHQTDHIANVSKQLSDNVNNPSHYVSADVVSAEPMPSAWRLRDSSSCVPVNGVKAIRNQWPQYPAIPIQN